MAAVFASGSRKEGDKAPTPAALADEYHYDSLDADTQNSFSRLVYLTPKTIDTVTWPQTPNLEKEFGKAIQYDVAQVSRKLFAMDAELPDRPVDEYDLAQALIPQDAQAEMRSDGIDFVPVSAVDCDVDGLSDHDPMDYSTHLPKSFEVKLSYPGTDSQTMTIPLGAAQQTTSEDIFTTVAYQGNFMQNLPIYNLPCWSYPQNIPAGDLKQVY